MQWNKAMEAEQSLAVEHMEEDRLGMTKETHRLVNDTNMGDMTANDENSSLQIPRFYPYTQDALQYVLGLEQASGPALTLSRSPALSLVHSLTRSLDSFVGTQRSG